jgi:hypothetical protein
MNSAKAYVTLLALDVLNIMIFLPYEESSSTYTLKNNNRNKHK